MCDRSVTYREERFLFLPGYARDVFGQMSLGRAIFLSNLVQYWTATPPESTYHLNIEYKPESG